MSPVKVAGETRHFAYESSKQNWGRTSLVLGFFAIVLATLALDKWHGFQALLGTLFALFLAVGSAMGLMRFLKSRRDPKLLTLRGDSVLLPMISGGGGFTWIRYVDIQNVTLQDVDGNRFITIESRMGKAVVSSVCFESDARFAEFLSLLVSKKKGLTAATPEAKPHPPEVPAETSRPASAADTAVLRAIQMGKASDPIIGAKFAGKEIFLRLTNALAKNDPRGVHTETLLCSLGALAGYACQASLRAQALIAGRGANSAFSVVKTKDGGEYFFGDEINGPLAEDKLSVWSVAAGAAQHAGARKLPDLHEIFRHTAASVGSAAFGVVRYPGPGAAAEPPIAYLRSLWPVLLPPVRELAGDPKLWPLAYGLALQQAIELSKDSLGPEAALTIAMEAAVPMSKVKL